MVFVKEQAETLKTLSNISKFMVIRQIEEIGSKKNNYICDYKVNGEIKNSKNLRL